MSSFETRLEDELVRVVEARAADAPPLRLRSRRRLALRVGAIAGVAAAAVTVPLLLLSGGGTPAYAVAENTDGSFTVTVNEIKDPAALEAKLWTYGLRSKVTIGERCGTAPMAAQWGTEPHEDEQRSGEDGQRSGEDGQRSGEDGQRSGEDGQRSGMERGAGDLIRVHDRTFRVDPNKMPAGGTIAIGFVDFGSGRTPFAVSIALVPAGEKLACAPWTSTQ